MPGTITSDQVTIKDAEIVADYLVLGTFATAQALNDDIKVQGTNAINGRVSANTAWSLAATSAPVDLTVGGRHVWQWLRLITWPSADVKINGGLGISISSDTTPTLTGVSPSNGPTNSKTWFLGGNDTDTTTGWVCYCIDPTGTPNLTLGTPDMSSVDRVGVRCKIVGTVSNKTLNLHHDVIRYGTGLTIVSGTSSAPVTFADIAAADALNTNAWGVVTQQSGIYFVNGKLYFGSGSQSVPMVFKDVDKVIVYPSFPVAQTFYELKLVGASSELSSFFQLGTLSGSLTSNGCTIRGASGSAWTFTGNASFTTSSIYGCTFSQMRRGFFNSACTLKNNTFVNSGELISSGALINGCVFQDVVTDVPILGTWALIVSSSAHMLNVTNCSFINCNRAIKLLTTGTYTFDNIKFSGNLYDVENFTTGLITINVVGGGSTPTTTSSLGGTTIVNSNVSITLTGLKNPTEVRVFTQGTTTEIAGQENIITGEFAFSVAAGSAVDMSILSLGYQNMRILNYSTNVDAAIPVSQQLDRQYNNP